MPSLDAEVLMIQNPAFGAAILAGFVQGFYEADKSKQGTPLPYLYLILPMVLHADFYRLLKSTKPSLRHLAEKFVSVEYAGTDLLLSLGRRASQMRKLTSESLSVMLLTRLARLDNSKARLTPRKTEQFSQRPDIPEQVEEAIKLGKWFADLSPFEIGSILKVAF
jgi:hypothetical protein